MRISDINLLSSDLDIGTEIGSGHELRYILVRGSGFGYPAFHLHRHLPPLHITKASFALSVITTVVRDERPCRNVESFAKFFRTAPAPTGLDRAHELFATN